MSRIIERLEDYRPFYDAVMAAPDDSEMVLSLRNTELVICFGTDCNRAILARGPLDYDLALELVDYEGWIYFDGKYYCRRHHPQI